MRGKKGCEERGLEWGNCFKEGMMGGEEGGKEKGEGGSFPLKFQRFNLI